MRWLCLTTAIILMSLSPCAAQDTPEIQSDGVFFPSTGRFIAVEPTSIIRLDPEEFPLGNIHVRRTVELLTQWRRVLVLEAQTYYELDPHPLRTIAKQIIRNTGIFAM